MATQSITVTPSDSSLNLEGTPPDKVSLQFTNMTNVAGAIEGLEGVTHLEEKQALIKEIIDNMKDGGDASTQIKKLKDEHHFTNEDIDPVLKKALKDDTTLSKEDKKAVEKAVTESFDSDKYSMKKTTLTTWLIAGAFFTLSVLFIAAGVAFPPMLPLGLLGGVLCVAAGLMFIGIDFKERAPENQYRTQANTQYTDNVRKLREAKDQLQIVEKALTQKLENDPTNPKVDEWNTKLNTIREDIHKFAKKNSLKEEIEEGEGLDKEKAFKKREALQKSINALKGRLDTLHTEIDPTYTPEPSTPPSSFTVTPSAAEASSTPQPQPTDKVTLLKSLKDAFNASVEQSRRTKTITTSPLEDANGYLKKTVKRLTDEQTLKLIKAFEDHGGLLEVIKNRSGDDGFDPTIFDKKDATTFKNWLEDVKVQLKVSDATTPAVDSAATIAPNWTKTTKAAGVRKSESQSLSHHRTPKVAASSSSQPASKTKGGTDVELFKSALETAMETDRKYEARYSEFYGGFAVLNESQLSQVINQFGGREQLMSAIDARVRKTPSIQVDTLFYEKGKNFETWLTKFHAELTASKKSKKVSGKK